MASQYHSLFTKQGLVLLRQAIQSGTKLGITHMSYGDGNGTLPEPNADFKEMVREVYRTPLNRLAASKDNPNWLEADGVIPSAVGGFNIREVGLWAGNVMVAYANYPPTYKPDAGQGTAQIKTIRIVLQIDNTANFELKIDASVVMATIEYVKDSKFETIGSFEDLKNYKPKRSGEAVTVLSVKPGKNKGGGIFVWNENSLIKADGGITIASNVATGVWARVTMETYKNVQWWGALGDGKKFVDGLVDIADDTDAIWNCLKAQGSYDWNGLSNPTDQSFCTVYFPASEGSYVFKRPLYLLPYMQIMGDSPRGGSLWGTARNWCSVLEPRFPNAENFEWAISTLNRVRASGELTAWDSNYAGIDYDRGAVTGCFGSSIKNILLASFDKSKRIYGGIRMQNAPQCSVLDTFVEGFDVACYSSGSWDSIFNFGSNSYKCGFLGYGDMNNTQINGYHHGTKSGLAPMSKQHVFASYTDPTAALSFDQSKVKYGVRLSYAYGFSSSNLILEYHDVGAYFNQCVGSLSSIYTEGNTRGLAFAGSNLNIGTISGISNNYSFAFGTGSNIEIGGMASENYSLGIKDDSNWEYNSAIIVPISVNLNGACVSHKNDHGRIYVSASKGNDANGGKSSEYAVKTIEKALSLILAKQRPNLASKLEQTSNKKYIYILDNENYKLSAYQDIRSDIEIIADVGKSPTIQFGNFCWRIFNSDISFNGVNVTRLEENNWMPSTGALILNSGSNKISFIKSNLAITGYQSLISVTPDISARLELYIQDGTNSMSEFSSFVEIASTSLSSSKISASIDQKFSGTILNRVDAGFNVPLDTISSVGLINRTLGVKKTL